jgi:hypothetical protein
MEDYFLDHFTSRKLEFTGRFFLHKGQNVQGPLHQHKINLFNQILHKGGNFQGRFHQQN